MSINTLSVLQVEGVTIFLLEGNLLLLDDFILVMV